eukprot:CCRYP_017452-RA/>CCRYP_017452-RA protein AED:0.08 eAED:0.09 QI:0/0.66/0.25/1/0/0/4/0/1112
MAFFGRSQRFHVWIGDASLKCLTSNTSFLADMLTMLRRPCYRLSVSNQPPFIGKRPIVSVVHSQNCRHFTSAVAKSSRDKGNRPNYGYWNVKDCHTVEDLLQKTLDKFHVSSPTTIAAAWNYVPVLLRQRTQRPMTKRNRYGQTEELMQRECHIFSLLEQTMALFGKCRPRELTTIIFSLAKIAREVRSIHGTKNAKSIHHQAFRNILFDDKSNPQSAIFQPYAEAAYHRLAKFDPRCLSNLAYSYALLGYDPLLQNGDTLFQNIAPAALNTLHDFDPQNISNTLWSYATLRVSHPYLFQSAGDTIAASSSLKAFKPQELSNILWAYARLHEPHPTLFEKVGDTIAMLDDFSSFKPQELSSTLWSYATLSEGHSVLFKRVGDGIVAFHDLKAFTPQALSNTVWAYAKVNKAHPGLFEKIGGTIIDRDGLESFTPQALANIVWAYATLNESCTGLFKKVGDAICDQANLNRFLPQELSSTVWSFATAKCQHPALFEKIGETIANQSDLKSFKSQELSNIVWAFATATQHHSELFKKVADSVVSMSNLSSFNPQELSNTVWAFATVNELRPDLFKKIGNVIVDMDDLHSFKPQELSNTVWAYAKVHESNPNLFKKVGDAILQRAGTNSFTPQELANIVWAFATLDEPHPDLFEKIGDEITARDTLNEFTPQNLSNIVWAYATVNEENASLFTKIGNTVVGLDDLQLFAPQSFSNIVWAHATANVHQPDLFRKIGDALVTSNIFEACKSQELSNTVWSFATANELRSDIFKKAEDAIGKSHKLESFPAQSLCNIAWSYAVANVDAPLVFNDAFIIALLDKQEELTLKGLRQLFQWHLWRVREQSNDGLPETLQEHCRDAFITANVSSSILQNDVISELAAIGLNPEEEFLTQSGYRLDALVQIDGKRVGIEVDGPSHFIHETAKGSTILKRRQVTTIDKIALVSIPHWDWNKLGKDRSKKQKYLKSLLILLAIVRDQKTYNIRVHTTGNFLLCSPHQFIPCVGLGSNACKSSALSHAAANDELTPSEASKIATESGQRTITMMVSLKRQLGRQPNSFTQEVGAFLSKIILLTAASFNNVPRYSYEKGKHIPKTNNIGLVLAKSIKVTASPRALYR